MTAGGLQVPASDNVSSNWRQGLRWFGRHAAIAILMLAYVGLLIVLPGLSAVRSTNSNVAFSLGFCSILFTSVGLAALASWWLKAALKPSDDFFSYDWRLSKTDKKGVYTYTSNYDTEWKENRLRSYKVRGRQLCLMMTLAAYYVPAVAVVVHNHGWTALDPYLRSHLLDGFTFVALIAAGWALLARNETRAIQSLARSTGLIALISVYLAGGSRAEIGVAAVATEFFGENFWQFIARIVVPEARKLEPPKPADEISYEAAIMPRQVVGDHLEHGMRLSNCECLISKNYMYKLVMCYGELAIWGKERDVRVWSSGSLGSGAKYAALQSDGTLCLFSENGKGVLWQSGLPGGNATYIMITDDGDLAAYRADNTRAWTLTAPRTEIHQLKLFIRATVEH